MQVKRLTIDTALWAGWLLAGVAGAFLVMFLFADAIDPNGNGPVGEGLLFLPVFAFLLLTGIALGSWRAWVTILKRRYSTSQYGAGVAKQIGDAHEENPNVDLSVRTFTGKGAMDQADQSIDLLNNQIGRSIGDANPGASMNQLAGAALDYYHSTGLHTASRNGDGSVSISQTKLSDQQYNAAKDQLKKMDKDGFQH